MPTSVMTTRVPTIAPPQIDTNNSSSSNSSTGSGGLPVRTIVIAGAILVLSVGGYYIYQKWRSNVDEQQQQQKNVLSGTAKIGPSDVLVYSQKSSSFDTSKWSVYHDESLGIQFKYPTSYQVISSTNEDGSYALQITDKNVTHTSDFKDKTNNAQILIHVEDQDEEVPADLFLQSAIHELSLAGSSVQTRNEQSVVVSGDLHGRELELMVTTPGPNQAIRMWVLVTTLLTKAITVQYTCTDMQLFDTTVAREIVNTLQIDKEKQYDVVSVRAHVAAHDGRHQISVTLPNYSYHVRKPYMNSDIVLCASIASGDQLRRMIEISEKKEWSGDLNQFISEYREKVNGSIMTGLESINISSLSAPAHLMTHVAKFDDIEYRCYDAIFEYETSVFIVHTRCLLQDGDIWKVEALKTISSIAFNERKEIVKDLIAYSNQTHKFRYDTNAEYFVKQHAVYPIVTFSIPPSAVDTDVISQTRIAVRDLQSPLSNTSVLKDILISELQSSQSTILEVVSDRTITISDQPAVEIVYRLRDPLTQQVLVFITTALVRESTKVYSIQSCVLEHVYNDRAYEALKKEHSSFMFL